MTNFNPINHNSKSFFNQTTPVWTNVSIVGVPGYPTYYGRSVIDADPTLNALTSYMSSLKLPFEYDSAVAWFT